MGRSLQPGHCIECHVDLCRVRRSISSFQKLSPGHALTTNQWNSKCSGCVKPLVGSTSFPLVWTHHYWRHLMHHISQICRLIEWYRISISEVVGTLGRIIRSDHSTFGGGTWDYEWGFCIGLTGIKISVTSITRVSSRNVIMPQRSCEFFCWYVLKLYHQSGMESRHFHSGMAPD